MKKIPKKWNPIVFAFLMSFFMAIVMSGALTAINLGVKSNYLQSWLLKAFPLAWIIAFPVSICAVMLVRKILPYIVES